MKYFVLLHLVVSFSHAQGWMKNLGNTPTVRAAQQAEASAAINTLKADFQSSLEGASLKSIRDNGLKAFVVKDAANPSVNLLKTSDDGIRTMSFGLSPLKKGERISAFSTTADDELVVSISRPVEKQTDGLKSITERSTYSAQEVDGSIYRIKSNAEYSAGTAKSEVGYSGKIKVINNALDIHLMTKKGPTGYVDTLVVPSSSLKGRIIDYQLDFKSINERYVTVYSHRDGKIYEQRFRLEGIMATEVPLERDLGSVQNRAYVLSAEEIGTLGLKIRKMAYYPKELPSSSQVINRPQVVLPQQKNSSGQGVK